MLNIRNLYPLLLFITLFIPLSNLFASKLNFRAPTYPSVIAPQAIDLSKTRIHENALTPEPNQLPTKKDTIVYLKKMIHLAKQELHNNNYNHSFTILWDILPIANGQSNKKTASEIHRKLGVLYGYYSMDSAALNHKLKGLELSKTYSPKKGEGILHHSYLGVATQLKRMNRYDEALHYLDSCYMVHTEPDRLYFVDQVYGQIYIKKQKYRVAQKYLNNLVSHFEKQNSAYLTTVYSYQAQLKLGLNEMDSALYFFQKSLTAINTFKTNNRSKPIILRELGNLYALKGNTQKAHLYLDEAYHLLDSLIIVQNKQNSTLFKIKTQYKEDLIKTTEQLTIQNRLIEVKDKASFQLKLLIGVLIVLACIVVLTFKLKTRLKYQLYEQKLLADKNDALLEVKNKELVTSALQIIEKERTIKTLLDKLKGDDTHKNKELDREFKLSNEKLWDDFHLRFTKINTRFYDQLLALHPNLTSTDLKHCALIRLNFDSKEMAHILGISHHSVHVSRSRLRKKLQLETKRSLSDYITKL